MPPAPRQPSLSDAAQDDGRDDVSVISAVQPLPPLGALPEIPAAGLDLSDLSLDSILGSTSFAASSNSSTEKVQKRASNVLKLSEENERLKAELRAMSERLEAAERKRIELEQQRRANEGGDTAASA